MSVFMSIAAVLAVLTVVMGCLYVVRSSGATALTSLFVALFVLANILSNKLIVFCGVVVPAGVIVFSATFLMTDLLSEVYGKNAALRAVWTGLAAQVVLLVTVWLAIRWPAPEFWQGQEAYAGTLGNTWRLVLASVAAYVVSQHHDVWAFHFLKAKTGDRHLWLRNNASTMVSQLLDSAVFTTIAFAGHAPVLQIMLGQLVAKFIIAVLDTPFIYLGRWMYADTQRA